LDDAILQAIREHAVEAAEALAAIQTGFGDDKPQTAESIAAASDLLNRDEAELWLDELKDRGLVLAFVNALRARGVTIDDVALADPDVAIPIDDLAAFLPRAGLPLPGPQERARRRQRSPRRRPPPARAGRPAWCC
jgi:hypothetical protein